MTKGSFLPALLLAGVLSPFGGAAHRKAEKGNRLYADGSLDDALRAYTEAQVAAPEAPELHYDIGNVLYRKGDFAGASEAFTRALLSAPAALAPDAAFNLGNALYQDGKYEEAVQAFRRSLERRPADADAKRNLELALRAMQRERDKKKQDPKDQDKKDKKDQQEKGDKGKPGDEGDQGKDKQEQKQQDTSDQDKDKDKQKDPQQQQADPKGSQGKRPESPGDKMSEQEAAQLLDRIGEEEKKNIKKLAAQKAALTQGKAPEKDW